MPPMNALEASQMSTPIHDLTSAYIQAVGEHRLDDLRPMLDPEAEFTLGDATFRGVDAFVGAFVRLMPILKRNDIRKLFVDGDEACVIYDFVTSTRPDPCSASSTSSSATA